MRKAPRIPKSLIDRAKPDTSKFRLESGFPPLPKSVGRAAKYIRRYRRDPDQWDIPEIDDATITEAYDWIVKVGNMLEPPKEPGAHIEALEFIRRRLPRYDIDKDEYDRLIEDIALDLADISVVSIRDVCRYYAATIGRDRPAEAEEFPQSVILRRLADSLHDRVTALAKQVEAVSQFRDADTATKGLLLRGKKKA